MIVFYLIGFLLLCAATVILLGLTPESITDDLMRFVSPKQTLRDKVLIAKGKKKSRRLTNEILHIKEALDATGNAKAFINGTYHGTSTKHLQMYLSEFCYRFNRRAFHGAIFDRLLVAVAR